MTFWILSVIILFQFAVIGWLALSRNKASKGHEPSKPHSPKTVAEFYNDTTDKFLQVYGEIIQAFRTNDVNHYLDYTIKSAKLENGMKAIDAGCGVCGPAVHFAKALPELKIDACTVSAVQVEKGKTKVQTNNLGQQVSVIQGDYHQIDKLFAINEYDRVYFLESFGHSNDKKKLLNSVWEVLKPGGMVYIKDLFKRVSENEWEQLYIDKICGEINTAYEYQIADLNEILDILRSKGYILHFVKIPEVETSEWEQLTISNDFQNLFNIGKIESWDNYVFPIDFYEILAEKPAFDKATNPHLYFMNQPK